MPAVNPRINIVLDEDLYKEVKKQAKAQGISLSLKVRDLVAQALNLNEDKLWREKADERRRSFRGKEALSHAAVWKTK